jgi:hypothetical protein
MEIRTAKLDDVGQIAPLIAELGYPPSVADLRERLVTLLASTTNCGQVGVAPLLRRRRVRAQENQRVYSKTITSHLPAPGVLESYWAGFCAWPSWIRRCISARHCPAACEALRPLAANSCRNLRDVVNDRYGPIAAQPVVLCHWRPRLQFEQCSKRVWDRVRSRGYSGRVDLCLRRCVSRRPQPPGSDKDRRHCSRRSHNAAAMVPQESNDRGDPS